MAQAVASGARSVSVTTVNLLRIEGQDIVEGRHKNEAVLASLTASDASVFGSSTHIAGPAAS